MQASALLLHWGSYRWAHNLLVLIIYLFFFPFMLPSVLPRLATDSAVRVFPGVWKPRFLRIGQERPVHNQKELTWASKPGYGIATT